MFQEVQCTSRLHPGAERLLVLLQSTAHTWNRDLLLAASLSGVFQVRVGNSKLQGDPLKIELPLMCALLPAALPPFPASPLLPNSSLRLYSLKGHTFPKPYFKDI